MGAAYGTTFPGAPPCRVPRIATSSLACFIAEVARSRILSAAGRHQKVVAATLPALLNSQNLNNGAIHMILGAACLGLRE